MGLFNFFKPKKNRINEEFERINNDMFPKGRRDIDSTIKELLLILDYKLEEKEVETIAIKSIFISRISEDFDKERLRGHLSGYCLQYFNEAQLSKYFDYLIAIKV